MSDCRHLWLVSKLEKNEKTELFTLYGRCSQCQVAGKSDPMPHADLPVDARLFEMMKPVKLASVM